MRTTILLICLAALMYRTGYSQSTTSYGDDAGTMGSHNSFFGHFAGIGQSAQGSNYNTAIGSGSMADHVVAEYNTAVGMHSLYYGGYGCVAIGNEALWANSYHPYPPDPNGEAYYNTAVGFRSMNQNQMGDYNTAVGAESLLWTHSNYNSGFGYHALHENNAGQSNTATGALSLYSNISGNMNTADGLSSLYSNISGYHNTAMGGQSLYSNTTGYRNTAVGTYALNSNLSGANNTGIGNYALYSNNMGHLNTGSGYRALNANTTGSYNTAQGAYALDDNFGGSYNTAIGYNAGPTVDLLTNTTAVGYMAAPTASNQVRIGNTSVTTIGGQPDWTAFSDGRFKKDIKNDVSGLEFITQLKPVSYTVDTDALNKFLHSADSSLTQSDIKNIPIRQTGFIAQDVEALVKKSGYVFSGVDAPENENDPYGIRYAQFVVPLVKAMQELAATVETQEKKISEQQKQIESLLGRTSNVENGNYANTSAALLQNNPNPFYAETSIQMALPETVGSASVMIYNLEGKQLKTMQVSERGDVVVRISANELAAGMYLYSLIADGKVVDTKRMVLTK